MSDFLPPTSFHFELVYKDDKYTFQEVSGIDSGIDLQEVRLSGQRLPRQIQKSNLTLKRGLVMKNSSLATWIQNSIDLGLNQPIQPADISVTLKDAEGQVMMAWTFHSAYPIKYNLADALSSELTIESAEFAYEHYSKK